MWIQVRSMDGKKLVRIDGLSKLTKIEQLREKLVKHFDAPVDRQRLFCRGKMMVDGHTLFDYNIALNEVILILVRPIIVEQNNPDLDTKNIDNKHPTVTTATDETNLIFTTNNVTAEFISESRYKVGDVLDIRDVTLGAWFEGDLVKVTPKSKNTLITNNNDNNNNNNNLNGDSSIIINDKDGDDNEDDGNDNDCIKVKADDDNNNSNNNDNNEDNSKSKEVNNEGGKINADDDTTTTTTTTRTSTTTNNSTCTTTNNNSTNSTINNDNDHTDGDDDDDTFLYHVKFIGDDEDTETTTVSSRELRPRSFRKISPFDLKVGQKVMVNYNYDEPSSRGYWYDAEVSKVKSLKNTKEVYATVYIGKDLIPIENCKLPFPDEIFAIEEVGTQRNNLVDVNQAPDIPNRQMKPECDHCKDNPRRKCKHCSCAHCGDKKDPEKQLMCDECNSAYHIYCLKPPLTTIPDDDEWFCPDCKLDTSQVVKAGEKLKESSKKSKMASSQSTSNRDWGKGMACQGRSKMCTIVPSNHFGPIPGVEVGSLWKFRVQVSESGVHRPHVAGIHGRESEGAYSIVLSGGYEDDVDNGDEFTYTGSGGRDLSGNKRTAGQSCDQVLTRMNRALAKNCDASINNKEGAVAKNWKAGKPVRVVRNCKGRKHSEFAPEEGNRYDGIYKVVKYWPEKGKSGFVVWKYLLRRDDSNPAPWTPEGIERSKVLGLVMQYPDGWEETKKEGGGTKRKADDDDDESNDDDGDDDDDGSGDAKKKRKSKKSKPKKSKKSNNSRIEDDGDDEDAAKEDKENVCNEGYSLENDGLRKLIDGDATNEKLWKEVCPTALDGKKKFLEKVESSFTCICCQDVVYQPITTSCYHNFCKDCLTRSFDAGVKSCAICRTDLTGMKFIINNNLAHILNLLFPGYCAGR